MELSRQSYGSDALVDETGDEDVLNLTTEFASKSEPSAEFMDVMNAALAEWSALSDNGQLPPATGIDTVNGLLVGPASILFNVSVDTDTPQAVYVGRLVARHSEVAGGIGSAGERHDGTFFAELHEQCERAIETGEPIEFELARTSEDAEPIHGLALTFSDNGEAIDHVLCMLDLDEVRIPEPPMPVLDASPGRAEKKDTEELLLVQEFEPKEIPNLTRSGEDDEVEPYLLISMENQAANLRVHTQDVQYSYAPMPGPANEVVLAGPAPELSDYLAAARDLAGEAKIAETRSRQALYKAISSAYDFALATADAPEDFADIIAQAGLTMQERAPMTPVVKLVFGADYDKSRLTEYATVLSHAFRLELKRGSLANYLLEAPGGLKEIVKKEREWRRAVESKPVKERKGPRKAIARKLRAMPLHSMSELPEDGDEFVLILARRDKRTGIGIVGEVPRDNTILERAARKLIAQHQD